MKKATGKWPFWLLGLIGSILLVSVAIFCFSNFNIMMPTDRLEELSTNNAFIHLAGGLKRGWDLNLDLPLNTEVHGAVLHPAGMGDESAWFYFQSQDPSAFVQSIVAAAKKNPDIKRIEARSARSELGDLSRPKDIPGWWEPNHPPNDLISYMIFNGYTLYIGCSMSSRTVYVEIDNY